MDIGSPFVSNAQTPEPVQPSECLFDDSAPLSQTLARLNAAACNPWRNVARAQPLQIASVVVALVGMQLVRRGIKKIRGRNGNVYHGLTLQSRVGLV